MNSDGFQERMTLVQTVLAKHGLDKGADSSPLAYDEDCPFPYNNFLYKIVLSEPATPSHFANATKYHTSLPPQEGVSSLIIRVSNPAAEGLDQTNRVQNEVAALSIVRDSNPTANCIPAVYDWSSFTEDGMGWILMEFKSGVTLDEHFENLSDTEKAEITRQIADLLSTIQSAPLPKLTASCGGLTIDTTDGQIKSGQMTTLAGGPWSTYAEFQKAKFMSQLQSADESTALRGWRDNSLRAKIDTFLDRRLGELCGEAGLQSTQPVLVHGDLTTNNILFDRETLKLTGLVDFDFSFIGHPFYEFLSSFGDIQGEQWEKAMKEKGVLCPANIQGAKTLELFGKLESQLAPFRLVHPLPLKNQSEEQIKERRAQAEKDLLETLVALEA